MAQTDSQQTTINGHNYRVHMLDPLVASDLLVEFGQLIGPALERLGFDAKKKPDGNPESTSEAALAAIGDVLYRLKGEQLRGVITRLGEVSYLVKGDRDVQLAENVVREHFRGQLPAMYQWLVFAVKTNFSDFFGSMGPVIAQGVQALGQVQ